MALLVIFLTSCLFLTFIQKQSEKKGTTMDESPLIVFKVLDFRFKVCLDTVNGAGGPIMIQLLSSLVLPSLEL